MFNCIVCGKPGADSTIVPEEGHLAVCASFSVTDMLDKEWMPGWATFPLPVHAECIHDPEQQAIDHILKPFRNNNWQIISCYVSALKPHFRVTITIKHKNVIFREAITFEVLSEFGNRLLEELTKFFAPEMVNGVAFPLAFPKPAIEVKFCLPIGITLPFNGFVCNFDKPSLKQRVYKATKISKKFLRAVLEAPVAAWEPCALTISGNTSELAHLLMEA